MKIIDVHTHFYPSRYLNAIRSGDSTVTVKMDVEGNPELHYPGDYNVLVPGHREINHRQEEFERLGITTAAISLTTPGTHVEPPARAVRFAQMVNDEFAEIVAQRNGKFAAYATLPLNDPKASVVELRRVVEQLGFRAVMLFSNVNGVPLADERYFPLYEAAESLGVVLHIHPTNPVNVDAMNEYWLMPLVGFLFDTTLAAANLVFAGIPERFPRIPWVLGHLGGAIPYLAERLDRGFHAFKENRVNIKRPPSEYLKTWYFDTVNFDPAALEHAVRFAGADHILAGSDYPHMIGSPERMKAAINAMNVSEAERAAIFGGNAARLLGL